MVTPIVDPVVELIGYPALYSEPPIPALPVHEQVPMLEDINEQVPVLVPSPLREVAGSPVRDDSSSFLASPAGSVYWPITSPISRSLRTTDVSRPLSGMATMDQSLPRDYTTFMGESVGVPLLPRALTLPLPPPPRPIVEGMVLGTAAGSPTGEPVAASSQCMPDLSREESFDVHEEASVSGGLSAGVGQSAGLSISHDFL